MIYKAFQNLKLSALGLGTMRLPVCDGKYNRIDRDALGEMVAYALENGINYFDTAWGYHGGDAEKALGEVLSRYPRESYYLATKFPGYDLKNMGKVKEIFPEQLMRCQTDYFDFYLVHNVCELNIDAYLDPQYETLEYLLEQKRQGRIRHLGFSVHGTLETMKRFLAAYGEHMEFCQIQLNWLDWKMQNAKAKVELLKELHLPIWVMEPVRGGRLFNLAPVFAKELTDAGPDRTTAEWAFRYVQSIPGVTLTLSGMSNMDQLKENIGIFSEKKPLTENEIALLYALGRKMTAKNPLPCTGCKYCTEYCPKELDIPRLIELYNNYKFTTGGYIAPKETALMTEDEKPSACIGCRACEGVCPQGIKISEMMADFTSRLK